MEKRIPPHVVTVICEMTFGFHVRQRQKFIVLMFKRYLRGRVFALRNAHLVKKKISLAEYYAGFEDFCYQGYLDRPTYEYLKFTFYSHAKLWPIHMERAGQSSEYCERYRQFLCRPLRPPKPSQCVSPNTPETFGFCRGLVDMPSVSIPRIFMSSVSIPRIFMPKKGKYPPPKAFPAPKKNFRAHPR